MADLGRPAVALAHGLPGGHSPFLARPAALADLLEKLTADSPAPAS